MTRARPEYPYELPEDERRLAHRILGKPNTLDAQILLALASRPQRYSDLMPFLRGRNHNNLTMAIDRLSRDGLVTRRTSARQFPVVHAYELSPQGRLVVDYMVRFQTLSSHPPQAR